VKRAKLSLFLTGGAVPDQVLDLALGQLDPAGTVSGAQERLRRLGYECGDVDGHLGVRTRSALLTFQEQNDLQATGELDEATTKKLVALFELSVATR
jgi:peptidoglycan hydrolase-like protein with peptidoglycan-binding domain